MEQQQLVKTARLAGIWYLLLAVFGVLGFMVFHPQVFIAGDAQQTLANLGTLRGTAHIRLLLELAIIVSQALAAVWFYKLFRGIDSWAATVLAMWGTVNAVVITVSAIAMATAIDLAGAASPAFAEKAALIQLLSSVSGNAWSIGGLFFGLWLLPMGYIVIQSDRMPVWLGRTLVIGGIGYLVQTVVVSAGVQSDVTGVLAIPATIGEFWMIGYLLLYGIRSASPAELA